MLESFKFELVLVRHGESEVNALPDLMGQTSTVKLTEKGKTQARLLGNYFKKDKEVFDKVYCSPYVRAIHTCLIAMEASGQGGCSITQFDELREYSAGDWIGASRKATLTPDIISRMNSLGQIFQPPKGESLNQVERRVAGWLDDNLIYNKKFQQLCIDSSSRDPSYTVKVLVVSHGQTIKSLLHYIMGFDQSLTWKLAMNNTAVCRLLFNDGWFIKTINNCSHLECACEAMDGKETKE